MAIQDIQAAVESYRKLSKEERAIFASEVGRRQKKRRMKRGKRAKKAGDAMPIREAMAPRKTKKRAAPKRRKPISTNGSGVTGDELGPPLP